MVDPLKIVFFEGLFAYHIGFLRRSIIKKIKKKWPHAEIEQRHWRSTELIFADQADIVIGHSFGAWAAIRNTVDVPLVITFDPRKMGGSNFVAMEGPHYLNFWQRAKFPLFRLFNLQGFEVDGGHNLRLWGTSHGKIVKHDKSWWTVSSTIGRFFQIDNGGKQCKIKKNSPKHSTTQK